MKREEIYQQLLDGHQHFCEVIQSLSDVEFMSSLQGKWTAGQQVEHICTSVYQTSRAFKFPKFMVRLLFGKANRPSKDYDALVNKYLGKIAAGGVAQGIFVPKEVPLERREKLCAQLTQMVPQMVARLQKYSEWDLDHYILPHPLLGKLTVREMLYFTIYHVEHHEMITLRNLKS